MPPVTTPQEWEVDRHAMVIIGEAFFVEATIALSKMQDDPPVWVRRFMERLSREIDLHETRTRGLLIERPHVYDAARVLIERWTGYCSVGGLSDEPNF